MRWTAMIAAALATTSASAQSAGPCRTVAAPPASLAGWGARVPLAAAGDEVAGRSVLAPGRAVDLALRPAAAVRPAVPPAKAPPAGSYGGLVSVMIDRPGTYRLALGDGAWVEVVAGGKAVAALAHDHGAACSGIRKMVDFALRPGRHVVQITGSPSPTIALMVARLP